MVKPVEKGEVITAEKVNVVEAGSYNLPEDTAKNADTVIGKYACADFAPGDSILLSKIAEEPIAENAYLYQLNGEKQAISVSVKAFANGLSGKLQSGDIVSVIAPDYRKQGLTVIPAELQYVEVIAVTANSGYDANTGDKAEEDSEKELPGTVTLLVTPEQSRLLAELEADGKLHLSLVYRGEAENAQAFITAQETVLDEMYHPADVETEGESQTKQAEKEVPGKDAVSAESGEPETKSMEREEAGEVTGSVESEGETQ